MLSKLRVQHYKSLFDTEVDLEPLTVFIGPNGSGKSNICESLAVLSDFLQRLMVNIKPEHVRGFFTLPLQDSNKKEQFIESKFWQGKLDYLSFMVENKTNSIKQSGLLVEVNYLEGEVSLGIIENTITTSNTTNSSTVHLKHFLVSNDYLNSSVAEGLRKICTYDFVPFNLSNNVPSTCGMERTGQGIAAALVDILHSDRKRFDELEERLTRLVPNIKRISLPREKDQTFALELIDRYSENHIPAYDISDGTLRILGFLTALYQENTPSIICFEEIENGVHPWLLHKMMELLKIVSTEGITGKPVQVLITTHSPVLLNYVEPYQVRAVELDHEGKTQVHALPTDSIRFQKALEAYDGSLGELWFTNLFGGNPA
jgi:AAA15 family ATPase/GTPase